MDEIDRAFHDLTYWPLEALPNTDSGAIEIRRRALEAALNLLRQAYPADQDLEGLLETTHIAIVEALEAHRGLRRGDLEHVDSAKWIAGTS
jgi:hypothetical protein